MSKKERPWYPHYYADYARDTAHLSMREDGAYRRLLDLCYATGGPLPTDQKQLHRLCRAVTGPERRDVDKVLEIFFVKLPEGFRNRRADVEIAKMAHLSQIRSGVAMQMHQQKHMQKQVQLQATEETTVTEVKKENLPVSASKPDTTKTDDGIDSVGRRSKKSNVNRGHRWPVEAVIPNDWLVDGYAARQRAGLTRINLEAEAEAFVDFWKAQPGERGVKLDWKATWRTWCRRASGQSGRGGRTQVNRIELARQALALNLADGGTEADGDTAAPRGGFDDV